MLRLVLAGSVAVLTILMAVACGGGDSPTSTAAQDGSGGSEVTAVPTSTAAQDGSGGSLATAAPTSTVARDSSGSSEVTAAPTSTVAGDSAGSSDLTESKYAAYCREATNWPEGEDELKTWGEVVQYGDRVLDHLENVTVPEELKDYHNALIAVFKGSNDFSRRQDASEPYDENLVNPDYDVAVEFVTLLGFSGTLDSEAVSQMRDAGCLL